MSGAESYAVAFKIGLVGSILLACFAVLGDTLAGLVALAVWLLVTLFALPWLYVCYRQGSLRIPHYLLKGPL